MTSLGIVGGLGPSATSRLYDRITHGHAQRQGGRFPDVVIASVPIDPSIERAYIEGRVDRDTERRMLGLLQHGVAVLRRAEVSAIALACNTLHCYAGRLDFGSSRFVDMVEATIAAAVQRGWRRAAVVGTMGLQRSRVYEERGLQVVYPDADLEQTLCKLISDAIHAGDRRENERSLLRVAEQVTARAEGLIVGCTDMSPLLERIAFPVPCIDSLEILAHACVEQLCN